MYESDGIESPESGRTSDSRLKSLKVTKSHYRHLVLTASAFLAHDTRPALNSATPTRVLELFQLSSTTVAQLCRSSDDRRILGAERRAYLLVDVAP